MADTRVPRIVVGIDGTEAGDAALRRALAEAARHDARLVVVSVWEPPEDRDDRGPGRYEASDLDAGHERLAREHVGQVASGASTWEIPIEVQASSGPPADVLIEAARDADLLVVGHGDRHGVSLGQVAQRCVQGATCAVLVVPPIASPDPGEPGGSGGNVLPLTRPRRPDGG